MSPYIQNLRIENLKNGSASLDLHPLTIITGRNGRGKSKIKDGLLLALLGYHPDLGKKPAAFAKLAGPEIRFGAAVQFSNGQTVSRAWKKTKTGASAIPGEDGTPPIDLATLDAGAFLSLAPAKQAALIASRSGLKIDFQGDILAKVKECLPATLADAIEVPAQEDFALWAEDLTEWLKNLKNSAAAIEKRMNATLEGMMSLDTDVITTISREIIEDARQRKANASAQAVQLTKQRDAIADELESFPSVGGNLPEGDPEVFRAKLEEVQKRIEPLARAYASFQAGQSTRTTIRQHIADSETDLESLLEKKAEIGNIRPPTAPFWLEECDSAELTEKSLIHETNELCNKRASITHEFIEAKSRLQAAEENNLSGECCPHCGASKNHWSEEKTWEAEEALASLRKTVGDKSLENEAISGEIKNRDDRLKELQAYLKACKDFHNAQKLNADIEKLEERLKKSRDILATLPAWEQEQAEDLDDLENERDELEQAIAKHDDATAAVEVSKQRDKKEADLADIKAKLAEAEQEFTAAADDLARLESKAAEADAIAARATEKQKAKAEADKAAQEKEAWGTALDVLQKECNEQTVKVFAPLLAVAREITKGCLPTELDNNGLELGRYEGAHFIGLSTFSGSERSVALAGILCAMAANGSGLVMIDEFSTFDDEKKDIFIDNLYSALDSGTIAQAILLDSRPYSTTLPSPGAVMTL